MQIGIFAKTFIRPGLEEILDAVKACNLGCVQFSMTCAGLPALPDEIDPALADYIQAEMKRRGLAMSAVSGTFNMIDPDLTKRRKGLRRLSVLASVSKRMGTSIITLCTGTRDPTDMWHRHVDNDLPDAWSDLVSSMQQALRIAVDHQVTLAFEPEVANVVDSAVKARRLLDEMRSSWLRVVMDPANLFHSGRLSKMRETLDEAFELLGDQIVIAHAKDLSHDGEAGHEAAGTGRLDYDQYLLLLRKASFDGPLILHSLSESQVDQSLSFLRRKLSTT
jgi:sugar phosphate isomerase/epimerase